MCEKIKPMKLYSKLIVATLMGTLWVSSGCKKYLDINQNPNAAAEPPIQGLLANATHGTAINSYYIADYTNITSDIHIITDYRRRAETSIGQHFIPDSSAMPDGAILP